jgi:hypothetical protein
MRSIKTIEQDAGLWFVYQRKGDGTDDHIGSIFDKGNKVAGVPNDGYQIVRWDGGPDPLVYDETKHFWSAVKRCIELSRLSCNY